MRKKYNLNLKFFKIINIALVILIIITFIYLIYRKKGYR